MDSCQVVFYGETLSGKAVEEVQQKVAALFKLSDQQAKVFFSGKRVVIKSGLTEAKATQYLKALEKAGAKAQIESADAAPSPSQPAQAPAKPKVQPEASASSQSQSAPKAPAAAQSTTTPKPAAKPNPADGAGDRLKVNDDYGVSLISQVDEQKLGNLQQATVAPAGTALSKAEDVKAPDVDISHLSFSQPGELLTDPEEEVVAKPVDISHLSLN